MSQASINIRGVDIQLERTGNDTKGYLQSNLPKLYAVLTEEEKKQLEDKKFCSEILGLSFPLLEKNSTLVFVKGHRRYYPSEFKINNYFVCGQWQTQNKTFLKWTEYLHTLI